MENIYIGFSVHNHSLLSSAIKFLDNSKYSHVYIRRKSKYGEYVYQASGLTVNFTNINIFLSKNTIIEEYEFELPDDKRDAILAFFIKYAGASYELSSLFKIMAIVLAKKINWDLKFKDEGRKEFICSELGAFFCKEILEIPLIGELDFITPKGLNPVVRKYGKLVQR